MRRPTPIAIVAGPLVFCFFAVSPVLSQLESEVFTILKTAATKIPPDPKGMLYALESRKNDEDRQKLADLWLKVWKGDPITFETFGTCLDGGKKAKEAAPMLIKMLHPTVSDKEVQQAGSDLLDQLCDLSAAERQRLQVFAKLAKARIRPPEEQEELDKFEGTWELVGYEVAGLTVLETSLKNVVRTLTIKGSRFTITWAEGHSSNPEDWKKGKKPSYVNEVRMRGTLRVKPTTDSKEIDFTYGPEGPAYGGWDSLKGKTLRGIYRWDDGKLVICLGSYQGSFAGERPTQFKTAAVEAKWFGAFLETLKKRAGKD